MIGNNVYITEFGEPWLLWALLLIPGLAFYLWIRRTTGQGTLLYSRLEDFEGMGRGIKTYLTPLPKILRLLALSLVIIACARPQSSEPTTSEVEGIDIFVLLDMSGSMQSIDLSEIEATSYVTQSCSHNIECASGSSCIEGMCIPDNRFQIAKRVLENFVLSREYDRMGMVVFAKDAFLQFPLTLDYGTILTLLDSLELGDIDGSGTAIGDAVGRGLLGLKYSKASTKIVILITDGDRRGGHLSPTQAAHLAKERGIKIFTILVGKEGTTLIPRNGFGYSSTENTVNPELLEELTKITDGRFYRAVDEGSMEQSLKEILDSFEKSRLKDLSHGAKTELYAYFMWLAVILLLLELIMTYMVLRRFP